MRDDRLVCTSFPREWKTVTCGRCSPGSQKSRCYAETGDAVTVGVAREGYPKDAARVVGMWIWDVYAACVSPREMGDVKSKCHTPYIYAEFR